MGQPGFFDVAERYGALDATVTRWWCSRIRSRGRNFVRYAKVDEKERKSPAGHKPLDPVPHGLFAVKIGSGARRDRER